MDNSASYAKAAVMNKPFCLLKSELIWLCPVKLGFEAKK